MTDFPILVDPDPTALRAAWTGDRTFAVLPARPPVGEVWVAEALDRLPADAQTGHFALLTSGSTGEPKLIVGERGRSERLARALHELQGNEVAGQTIVALPLTYSFAFINQWLWSVVHERALVRSAGLAEPAAFRATLREARDAMLCLVGVQGALLADAFGGETFEGIVRLHFAGGRFPQERLDALRTLFPAATITNNYGCAEAMPRLTLRPADSAAESANIGRPLPGIDLRAGDGGALEFRSPYGAVFVAEGERLTPVTPEQWVPTGDLGEELPDGAFRLTGRASEVFKRHGEKVSLPAILATVHEAWPHAAGVYRTVDRSGEPGYVLVLAPVPEDPKAARVVLKAFRERHGRAHWPLRIEALDALPELANGKLDVPALAAAAPRHVLWDQRT
jgi:acyl-CoA synthetase (AMP-forming)/AMP-acid ligase II